MAQKTKLQQVVEVMIKLGYSPDQIAKMNEDLTKLAFNEFYSRAMVSFKEEDFQTIDQCKDQDEANKIILERYTLRTNQNPDEEIRKFLETFAEGFLKEYEAT